jgi:hypothetical protein
MIDAPIPDPGATMAIQIHEKDSGRFICDIGEADLAILVAHMEEESSTDQDYFVEHTAIDAIEAAGASAGFVTALRTLVGNSDGVDIRWSRS